MHSFPGATQSCYLSRFKVIQYQNQRTSRTQHFEVVKLLCNERHYMNRAWSNYDTAVLSLNFDSETTVSINSMIHINE